MKIDRFLGILNIFANTDRTTIQKSSERFEVILEYDVTNELFLTDKIDAKFFYRNTNAEEKGRLYFLCLT